MMDCCRNHLFTTPGTVGYMSYQQLCSWNKLYLKSETNVKTNVKVLREMFCSYTQRAAIRREI